MQSVLQRLQLSSSKSSSFRPSSIPCPTAWDSSTFLNPGVSEDSLKDAENICNEEHKEQKVIGKSDQKSSDECSEAKSQESESPEKKHGGGLRCSERKPDDIIFLEKISSHFRRNNKGRNSVCSISSSLSAPGGSVPEKLPLSTRSPSLPIEIVKDSRRSKETSPTHEGGPEWQQRLNPDQREELRLFLSPELQKKLDSHSFLPGEKQHLYLTHTLSGKRELSRFQYDSEQSQLLRLTKAQLPDNSSSKRDSGYSSGLPAFPAVPHKESVSSGFEECSTQQVKLHSVEHT